MGKRRFFSILENRCINEVKCRTGIHSGNLIVGNIGSEHLIQYSAIGDAVNIASRLERKNKDFGTDIAISEEVHTALPESLVGQTNLEGEMALRGRSKKMSVFSL